MIGTTVGANKLTNHALLKATRDGDREALAEYASRVLPSLRDSIDGYLIIRGRSDWTEDICQEVILKVVAIIRKAGAEGTEVPDLHPSWLFRAGKNIAVDWLRRERRKSELKKAQEERFDEQGERQRERRLIREQVEAILSHVPTRYAALLRLRYIEGLKIAQAAKRLKLSIDAAYKKEQRSLEHMRQLLRANPQLAYRIFGTR